MVLSSKFGLKITAVEKFSVRSLGLIKKMSECRTKAGNQECFENFPFRYFHSLTLDMLNNVYAQKSLIIGENGNDFFDTGSITLPCEFRVHRAGSQLIKKDCHFHLSTVTFEHRHENKSCSACPSDQHKHLTYDSMT